MIVSSNGSISALLALCAGVVNHTWIPLTKASDAELWCFFDLCLSKFDVMSYPYPNFNGGLAKWTLTHCGQDNLMTSSNGNIFRVTVHLCGSPHKGQWRGALMVYLICTRINGWVNNGEVGGLRRHLAHYDVTVMKSPPFSRRHIHQWKCMTFD